MFIWIFNMLWKPGVHKSFTVTHEGILGHLQPICPSDQQKSFQNFDQLIYAFLKYASL